MNDVLWRIEQYGPGSVRAETVSRVKTASVMFADYDLLRTTFPELASLDEDAINKWLLENAAYISQSQAAQTALNSKIKTAREYTIAFRPPEYGRAGVFSLAWNLKGRKCRQDYEQWPNEGCLDVKGIGIEPSRTPRKTTHGTGLLLLSMALRELICERIIHRVLEHAGSPILTARNYALIDLGFNAKYPKGVAGLLVRQAYLRDHGLKNAGSIEEHLEMSIELLLRRYGLSFMLRGPWIHVFKTRGELKTMWGRPNTPTTPSQFDSLVAITGPISPPFQIDGLNVQFTRELCLHPLSARLIDLASLCIYESFENAFATLVEDRPLFLGKIVFPNDVEFVQPDPRLRVRMLDEDFDDQCLHIVKAYHAGVLSPDDVSKRVTMIVEKATEHL